MSCPPVELAVDPGAAVSRGFLSPTVSVLTALSEKIRNDIKGIVWREMKTKFASLVLFLGLQA